MLNGAFGTVTDTWREILQEYRQANEDLIELVEALVDVSRYEANGSENLNWEPLDWEHIFTQATNQVNAIYQRDRTISADNFAIVAYCVRRSLRNSTSSPKPAR